jgi:hypothetical protein
MNNKMDKEQTTTTEKMDVQGAELKSVKLAKATYSFLEGSAYNPYSPSEVDKLDLSKDLTWKDIINLCKFFYKHEPYASTTINKLIDISINDIIFDKNGLSVNELKVFEGIKEKLLLFSEQAALEFLLSGLIVPEFKFGPVNKKQLKIYGVKKYDSLILPISMWVRDPATIIINKTILSDIPSYFVEVPEDLIYFIIHKGVYPDGTKDLDLYNMLQTYYPDFVTQVEKGIRRVLLTIDPNLVIRRRVTTDTAYPTPFLFPALEAMKHKRNLRRMDYSISSRVISAIMLVRLGDKDFPITEDDTNAFTDIQKQLLWRDSSNKNVERVFQLFANHTLQINWVYPPTEALLNQEKYASVNEDILVSLGFPRILITGEAQRSQTTDAAYATAGPVKTMESMRKNIEFILNYIVEQIAELNGFKSAPEVRFRPLQLADYAIYMASVTQLYQSGNLSRTSYAKLMGFNWEDEIEQRIEEERMLKASGLPEFAPTPNSRVPENTSNVSPADQQKGDNPNNKQKQQENSTASASENYNSYIDKLVIALAESQTRDSNIRLDLTPFTMILPESKPPVVNITMPEQKAAQVDVQVNVPEQKEPTITFSPIMDNPTPIVNVTVPAAQITVENNIPVPEVTVNNNVQTPDVTVNNNVPVPEVTVENTVNTPDVTVNNSIPVPEVTVNNNVQTPEVKIDNTVSIPEDKSTTETITVHRDVEGKITSMTKQEGK